MFFITVARSKVIIPLRHRHDYDCLTRILLHLGQFCDPASTLVAKDKGERAGVIDEVEALFLPMMSVGVAKSTQADFN